MTEQKPTGGTGLRGALRLLGELTVLEVRRVARGWRLRAALLVAFAGAFWWRRAGFGPGSPVFFPLGESGLIGFSALWGVTAALLGTDALGQLHRSRARRWFDTRPIPDILVALSRWLAVVVLLLLGTVFFLLEVWGLSAALDQPCALMPLIAVKVFWWIPLICLGAALGLAARAWIPNDAAALGICAAGLGLVGWGGWWMLAPLDFFRNYTPSVGLLAPVEWLARDLGVALLVSLGLVGWSAVGQRGGMPKSPFVADKAMTPRRLGLPTLRRLGHPLRRFRLADRFTQWGTIVVTVLAGFGMWEWGVEWKARSGSGPIWNEQAALFPEELARNPAPLWSPERLECDLGASPDDATAFRLTAYNPTTATLTQGAMTLSPVWDTPGQLDGIRALRPGPVAGTWVFEWTRAFEPMTTQTLSLSVRPRRGFGRMHAWARNPRYSDYSRLGYWWPRACGFDLLERRVVVPSQPVQYRLRVPEGLPGTPLAGTAEARKSGGVWELESRRPEARLTLIAAPHEEYRRDFQGMEIRWRVFSRHGELADYLLDAWERRFVKIRRTLGPPPIPFVFYEAPTQDGFESLMALPSTELDALEELRPLYRREPYRIHGDFNEAYARRLHALLETWADAVLGETENPLLLREALVSYLFAKGFLRGHEEPPNIARERPRQLLPFERWEGPVNHVTAYQFRENEATAFRSAWDENRTGWGILPEAGRRRAESFHHVIRYLLGDDRYAEFLRTIFSGTQPPIRTTEDFIRRAQSHCEIPLAPILEQIVGPMRLPIFSADQARVFLDRDAATGELRYTTEVRISNSGQGRWPTPAVLSTEEQPIERQVFLDAGESRTLTYVSRSRPVVFAVDPWGRLPQLPRRNPKTQKVEPAKIFLKTITDRTQGP